jgi:branched-subunit amino acid transport protein
MADSSWHWLWPWAVVLLSAVVTYAWRWLGVALSGRIDPNGAMIRWVGAVAYALLAGLIARMIVLPQGPLQETAMTDRIAAAAIALVIFLAARRNLVLGVAAGAGVLVLLTFGRLAS